MFGDSVGEMVFDLREAESVLDEASPVPSPAATIFIAATAAVTAAASASSVDTPALRSSPATAAGVVSFRWLPGFVVEQ